MFYVDCSHHLDFFWLQLLHFEPFSWVECRRPSSTLLCLISRSSGYRHINIREIICLGNQLNAQLSQRHSSDNSLQQSEREKIRFIFFFFCFLNFQINLKCHNFVNIQYINISLHEDKTKYMIFALHIFPQSSSAEGTENFLSCPSLAEHDQLHSKFDCLHSQRFVDPNEF